MYRYQHRPRFGNPTTGLAGLAVLLVLCIPLASVAQDEAMPELSFERQKVLVDWLDCSNCPRDKMPDYSGFTEAHVTTLRLAVQRGPGPAQIARSRQDLRERYREMLAHAEKYPQDLPRGSVDDHTDFVQRFVGNYIRRYQRQAADMLTTMALDDDAQAASAAERELRVIRQDPEFRSYPAVVQEMVNRTLEELRPQR